jgi:hypothetical protein
VRGPNVLILGRPMAVNFVVGDAISIKHLLTQSSEHLLSEFCQIERMAQRQWVSSETEIG